MPVLPVISLISSSVQSVRLGLGLILVTSFLREIITVLRFSFLFFFNHTWGLKIEIREQTKAED